MSGRRLLTSLAATKIPFTTTYSSIRAIHVLPRITTCLGGFNDESWVDRRRRLLLTDEPSLIGTLKRYKSGRKKNKQAQRDEESDEDEDIEEELEEIGGKNAKVTVMNLSSMRVDLVVKSGMNMARAKAEEALYESKIRINGGKVMKKSTQVKIGDVIDVVRGVSPQNPEFLIVSRLTILTAVSISTGYRIKAVKEKSVTIENYDDSWTPVNSQ